MELSELKRFEIPKIGVYFLFEDDMLIYIGMSINIFQRLQNHIRDKRFDNYAFIKCKSFDEAKQLERDMIIKFKPMLNIQHKKSELDNSYKVAVRMIEKVQTEYEIFGIKKREPSGDKPTIVAHAESKLPSLF